jgi:mitochondrial translocator assembly and maintenance protein 41
MLSDKEFAGVVKQFPAIDFGFAYGSGVVRQDGYDYESANKGLDATDSAEIKMTDSTPVVVEKKQSELPMVDMIFAVDDPKAWHTENMRQNPDHYTPLMTMNPVDVTRMQDSYGAGMWYNAMIAMNIPRCPSRMMKYGVISRQK